MAAVLETIQKNYVRPDESNRAQMLVQQKGGTHSSTKSMLAITRRRNDRGREWRTSTPHALPSMSAIYQVGMTASLKAASGRNVPSPTTTWKTTTTPSTSRAEAHSAVQVRFRRLRRRRQAFHPDEWLDVIIRSFGMEPGWMTEAPQVPLPGPPASARRVQLQLHRARARGNGKSYTFSEFSPYATLLGAPTSAATLWWNAARKQVGVIGYWDVVAFDEVGEGIVVRDKETFQVMKQYMANGNFNRCQRRLLRPTPAWRSLATSMTPSRPS